MNWAKVGNVFMWFGIAAFLGGVALYWQASSKASDCRTGNRIAEMGLGPVEECASVAGGVIVLGVGIVFAVIGWALDSGAARNT